jgi:hypothetical protein
VLARRLARQLSILWCVAADIGEREKGKAGEKPVKFEALEIITSTIKIRWNS